LNESVRGVIDSHCHLDFKQFNKDRDAVLQRARDSGVVLMINSGVDYSTNRRSLELAKKYDFIFATLGLSPNTLDGLSEDDLNKLLEQIKDNASQAVGIGEAGLDYYHCKDAPGRERQAQVFGKVIELAKSQNLPLVIHSRDAEQQALDMVKHLDKVVFHCYSGSLATMKEAVDRGFISPLPRIYAAQDTTRSWQRTSLWTNCLWRQTALFCRPEEAETSPVLSKIQSGSLLRSETWSRRR